MKSTFKDEREMESSLFPITDMITWIFWELSLASKDNPLACPIAVSRDAHNYVLISLTARPSDPYSDDDINNDVSSLYAEIYDPSDDPGKKNKKFDAKGKPSGSTL